MTPLQAFDARVAAGDSSDDPAQRRALAALTRIYDEIEAGRSRSWLQRAIQGRVTARGLYLWGGVGRGKTFLMDLFFDQLPVDGGRLHFHRFMGRVHAELARLSEVEDPLQRVAQQLADEARVWCLDEFVVSDIGDAMILGRLLKHLFAQGVTLVTTSNTQPNQLYRNGLQRAQFLPAIALIEQHCEVLELVSAQDYRLRALTQASVYHTPLGATAEAALERAFARLAPCANDPRAAIVINGRDVPVKRRADDVIWFTFDALCRGPRSAADYIEIAQTFSTVLLSDVPVFDVLSENEAKRFVHLIDEFYDRRIKLLLSAAASPVALYRGERIRAEFERTASRLIEMQSEAYLAESRRSVGATG